MIKTIISCMQLRSIQMSIATVIMGWACSNLIGDFEPLAGFLCLLFAIFAQITANLFHYYCDEKFHYGQIIDHGYVPDKSSGISLERMLREASIAFAILTATVGLALVNIAPKGATIMGVLIILAIYFNNAGPYPLCRHTWDLVLTFLFFGPLGTGATAYMQSVHARTVPNDFWGDVGPALIAGIAMGLFVCNSKIFFGYRTVDYDKDNAIESFTSKFGKKATRNLFLINSIIIFIVAAVICYIYHLHNFWWAIVIPVICTIVNILLWRRLSKEWTPSSIPWENIVNWNALLFSISAFIEFTYFGASEDFFTYFG
ncbi:MAG: prenyltransferase [Prevotella sp.]|nr:prenyltransferase [Bacteroides sp.]MCM1366485.1 prenyltransferase [Prevotella sp.]MCM1436824.1 prenyltransferase [Prevotella sp.]